MAGLVHGQQSRVKRHIVGTVVAITTSPLNMAHDNGLFV
jgi:hypothetical protein